MKWKKSCLSSVTVLALGVSSVVAPLSASASTRNLSSNQSSGKVLTFWHWRAQDTAGIAAVGKLFQQQTGYSLQISSSADDATYYTKLQAAARTGTLPDIVALNYGTAAGDNSATFAKSGLLVNLTKDFTPSWQAELVPSTVQTGLITPAVIKSTGTGADSLQGLKPNQIWAVPYMGGSASMIYVKKSALAAAHLSTTTPPATYQQLVSEVTATQKALGSKGGIVMGLGQDADWNFFFDSLLYSWLGQKDYVSTQSAHPIDSFSSPKTMALIKLFNELTPLWIPGALTLNITPAVDAFDAGRASWYIGGTFDLSGIVESGIAPSSMLAFPVPPVAGGAVTSFKYDNIGLAQVGISTDSKVPMNVALAFIKLLTGPVGGTLFAQYGHNIPAAKLTSAEWTKAAPEHIMGEALALQGGFDPYDTSFDPPTPTSVDALGSEILNTMIAGKVTPEQAGQQLTKLVAQSWAEYGGK
jgi:multiple sugar transport system substrate-binding protein